MPSLPRATHRVVDGQVTDGKYPPEMTDDDGVHADAPPVGFVDVKTFPESSTVTHSVAEAHETENRLWLPSISAELQPAELPVGFVDQIALPDSSTATHKPVVGHEMAANPTDDIEPPEVCCHADAPPVGLVDVTTLPPSLRATQRVVDGQLRLLSENELVFLGNVLVLSMTALLHVGVAAAGSVDVRIAPE